MRKMIFGMLMLLAARQLFAGEGMWIPMLLGDWNEKEMQSMGLHLTADDLYSINHSSMKDAIVLFGGGCTAEIVSDKGLLFTNHHCGYGAIQKHSSLENDYLTNGFWAASQQDELPNPGLTVTMLMKMDDVTDQVLLGLTPEMNEKVRNERIKNNSSELIKKAREESGWETDIRSFYNDNKFYMLYNQVFKDIRLVGAPPSLIGKFGGDTDNWMWPRHTGDFSVFRIYAGKDNKPAEYNTENVPFRPDYHFHISLKGVDEGDFTFVYGYPARTSEYLPSQAIQLITEESNPHKINLRGKRLEIFGKYAASDPAVRIQYASKDAGVANGWKKMIGESRGIQRLHGIEKKQTYEEAFQQWANSTNSATYTGITDAFKNNYALLKPLKIANDFVVEAGLGIELVNFSARFKPLVDESIKKPTDKKKIDELSASLTKQTTDFFKDYYEPIDREVAVELLWYYLNNQSIDLRPAFLNDLKAASKQQLTAEVNRLYDHSVFANKENLLALMRSFSPAKARKMTHDPVWKIMISLRDFAEKQLKPGMMSIGTQIDSLQRLYMKGQMEMEHERRFYPDANFTLRITYGRVGGFEPADAVYYDYFTTLEGIIEKENPEIADYLLDDKLKKLYNEKNYGPYADKEGKLRVAFSASNHTTGGNSGSPVMNAEGQLVGINFDRCWEGTMSDLMYDPALCRNISVDIRYVLFVIDKYASAGHLINELTLIN